MRILYIEPFNSGSHAQFTRVLTSGVDADWTTLTMPGRHWKWRARGAAPYLAIDQRETLERDYDVIFCGSYLNLAELTGLVPKLASVPSVYYFHENQLAFPVREERERDHHFGVSQLISCLSATRCVFNSRYNLESFLSAGDALLSRLPDRVPSGWIDRIRAKSEVLPVPLELDDGAHPETGSSSDDGPPLILWNHRWEFDKGPDAFFTALIGLEKSGVDFRLAVCGHDFEQAPPIFERARRLFASKTVQFGEVESRAEYLALLARSDIVVSTAIQEFFGVSVLEAVHMGARPLVPDRLAYRELFDDAFRYSEGELRDALSALCQPGVELRADRRHITRRFLEANVLPDYEALLASLRPSTDARK